MSQQTIKFNVTRYGSDSETIKTWWGWRTVEKGTREVIQGEIKTTDSTADPTLLSGIVGSRSLEPTEKKTVEVKSTPVLEEKPSRKGWFGF